MKKKICLLLASMMLTCACSNVSNVGADSNTEYWGSFNLKEEYSVNDSLYLDDVILNVGSISKATKATLRYPSGKITDSQSNILNESGKYIVTYSTVIEGKYYEKSEDFFVATPYFSHGENSSTYYGIGNKATHAGLVVKLAKNDELTFSEIIDLTDLTKNDELIKLYMTPTVHGSYDLSKLIFKFTDIADSTNYFEITLGKRAWKPEAYPGDCTLFGKGDDCDRVSAESWTNGLPNGGGTARGYVVANSSYGSMMRMTMNGLRTVDTKLNYGYKPDGSYGWISTDTGIVSDADYDTTEGIITYDYAGMELGSINMKMDFKGCRTNEVEYKKAWDFDDPVTSGLVNGGYGKWRGFTSGKCRLTIHGEQFESNYANFVLTKVHGVDLTQKVLNDVEGPEITIDSSSIIDGVMSINGKAGCYYNIPDATAVDQYYGVTTVSKNVYLNYGTNNQINIDTVENRFFPKTAGTYTIEYKSSDNNDNVSIKTVDVIIEEASPSDIVLNIDSSVVTTTKQGVYYKLPDVAISGGRGEKTIKAFYIFNNEKVEIADEKIIFEKTGRYTIRFECTDFIGQTASASYGLTVTVNNDPFILDEPVLPRYYLAGGKYTVPFANVIKYINDEKTINYPTAKVEYKIVDETSTEQNIVLDLNVGDSFSTANIVDNSTLKISYYYEGALLSSYSSPTINPLYYDAVNYQTAINIKKYFVNTNVKNVEYDLVSKEGGYKFISNGQDFNVEFANQLLADKFYLGFIATNDNLFSSLKVTLKDAENPSKAIALDMTLNANKTFTVTCGDNSSTTRAVTLGSDINPFAVSFDGTNFIVGDNDVVLKVDKMVNGKEFTPFESHLVYASFEVKGLDNDKYISLKKIGNHEFEAYSDFYGNLFEPMNDYVEPQYYIEGDLGKYGQINEKAITDLVIVQDVLAPTSFATVTVSKDRSNYVSDVNGNPINELDAGQRYEFMFTKTEVYTARYVASELSEYQTYWVSANEKTIEYSYGVIDTIKPIITLTSLMHTETQVGGTLSLTTFKVSDNVSAADKITVIREMILPSGRFNEIKDGINKYQFNEAGEYEFRIVAIDEALNVSMYSTFITVY